ncbi:MAG: tripartite tricarboxylate transporter TctB family protein [Synergistaceae bacterium]|jgi:hypothetical protein|nr:tripartite tricarboxylate transporter TctB family protein [Synergistaceae bacterium]
MKDHSSTSVTKQGILSPLLVFDGVLFLFGILFLLESRHIKKGFQQVLDARIYPRVVAVIFCATILAHLIQLVRERRAGQAEEGKNPLPAGTAFRISALFVLFIAYIYSIQTLGYFEAGFLFLWLSIALLGENSWQWRGKALAIALLVISVTYFIFGVLLNIYVPPGLFL